MNDIDKRTARHPDSDNELVDNLDLILSTIRHQLGNSVNAIKVTLEVLKQNFDIFDDGKKKEYIERGFHLLARQQAILEAMRTYSRFDTRDQTEITAAEFWEHIVERIRVRLEGTRIAVEELASMQPATIQGNMIALEKVIDCVLENAVEAVEEIEEPRIHVQGETGNGHFHVILQDNGRGMTDSDLQRIRVPLFTTKPGKAGIGLSIAHKLVARMRGRMRIESTLDKGTRVRISLPAG